MPDLTHLGFSEFFARQLPPEGSLTPARIVGQHRREWDVQDERGVRRAALAGRLWHSPQGADDVQPTVGDWVLVRDEGHTPIIERVLERRSFVMRAVAGGRQILVANVDFVAVVAAFTPSQSSDATARRGLSPRRLERYVAAVKQGGATPLIILNKADLVSEPERQVRDLARRLEGVTVLSTHCLDERGVEALKACFHAGQTVGFMGLSGVGKSSLVNLLLARETQRTAPERHTDARGRHTTSHRALFESPEGIWIIDTPGMREFALADASVTDLEAFSDIQRLAEQCRFRNCQHQKEPGCAVKGAVAEKRLSPDRVANYRTLQSELQQSNKLKSESAGSSKRRRKRSVPAPARWEDE